MTSTLHAIDYLEDVDKHPAAAVSVVFGDELFLKREVLRALRQSVLGPGDGEFSYSVVAGRDAQMRDVMDELATVPLFGGGRRMVLIDQADDFVSRHRAALEDYVARPIANGVLVLDVATWASNTRLYKAVAQRGLQMECKRPPPARLRKWIVSRGKQAHKLKLTAATAELLLDLVEPDLGLVDQELAKLALVAGRDGSITPELIQEHVGSWRTKTTWELIDSAAEGDARAALIHLDRLLLAGESPIGLAAQMAYTLRRMAAAARLVEQAERQGRRITIRRALEDVGVKRFVLDKSEHQLRQVGRERARRLHRWLLEADLALKGASSAGPRARLVLEQLIVRLSKAAAPQAASAR